jgi:hypothetical protein
VRDLSRRKAGKPRALEARRVATEKPDYSHRWLLRSCRERPLPHLRVHMNCRLPMPIAICPVPKGSYLLQTEKYYALTGRSVTSFAVLPRARWLAVFAASACGSSCGCVRQELALLSRAGRVKSRQLSEILPPRLRRCGAAVRDPSRHFGRVVCCVANCHSSMSSVY